VFDTRQNRKLCVLDSVQTGCGVHPASYPMGTGVKQPERVAGYSSPSSVKDRNVWGLNSTRRNSVPGYYLIEIQA
jgi:hypothetical protein